MKKYFVANWKMTQDYAGAEEFFHAFLPEWQKLAAKGDRECIIAPSFVHIPEAMARMNGMPALSLGAQNMSENEPGAYTGDISAAQLRELGVQTVILGHSEQRREHGETDELVNAKLVLALQYNLNTIICVGETLAEREAGRAEEVVLQQLSRALKDVDLAQNASKIMIAYEPVWAIGTGKAASSEDASAMHAAIRRNTTPETPILYGGSVQPENAASFLTSKEINGVLVGFASTQADQWTAICSV